MDNPIAEWLRIDPSDSDPSEDFNITVAISGDTVVTGAERESGSGAGAHAVQNGNGALCSGAAYGFVIPASIPEIMVEAAGMPELVDGGATLVFAPAVPEAVTTRALTLRNTGTGPLVVSGWSFSGANAGEFSIDASGMPDALAPGAAGILRVQFSGAATGSYPAALAIHSNDADEASFDLALSASVETGAALYAAWTSSAGLSGEAAEATAAPRGDGVPNLMKYAFRLNGAAADRHDLDAGGGIAGLPVCRVAGDTQELFRLEYLRRKGSGISYLPKVSGDLDAGSFVPMSGAVMVTDLDSQWERVRIDQPRGAGEAMKFGIVEVTLP